MRSMEHMYFAEVENFWWWGMFHVDNLHVKIKEESNDNSYTSKVTTLSSTNSSRETNFDPTSKFGFSPGIFRAQE